ncbi:DNA polymerase II [archaeon BMS3Abin16]|nr:DNA polymerase II [archaeon BMS3Abin16]HDY74258.1 DNA polymerase [Euryarchaeota archaeon]
MSRDLLLDIDYKTVDEKAELRLFLRNETVFDKDFQPYIYVELEDGGAEDELSVFGSCEAVTRLYYGVEKKVYKLTVSHPGEVPKIREELRNMDSVREIYEHDILFSRRYLIDKRLVPLNYAEFTAEKGILKEIVSTDGQEENLRVMAFDIEVYNPKGAPRVSVDPVIMLSYAASTGRRGLLTYKDAEAPDYVTVVEDEKTVLRRFCEIVEEEGIDILVGYNSDQFDIPYILDRAKTLGVDFPLGRLGLQPSIRKGRGLTESVIRGRPHVDLYPVVRRNVKLSSYVLENVVLDVLGIEKEKIPAGLMWQYWDRGGADLRAFMQYSIEDVDVTLELAEKFLPLYIVLSQVVGLPIQDTSRMTAGQLVEWLLIREAFVRGELVPNKGGGKEYLARAGDTYAGGYVMEPVKGLVENIVVFDFRSLYPSIIVTHNIDPTTLRAGRDENSPPELDFHFATDEEGFIPSVLKRILDRRLDAKRRMKDATDPFEKKMLNVTQNALKIIANSFYGYMGYPRARWYKKECAESTTSYARMYTKLVMKIAEEEYGFKVVYGDTDSLFMVVPPEKRERAMEFMRDANKRLPGTVELEYDGFYPRGIFITKKRYALIDEKENITVKGLETVRRDWVKLSRDTQQEVLSILLKEGDPMKAVQIVKDRVATLKERRVSLDEITLFTQLTKNIKSYKNKGPHVRAAEKSIERGREVNPGTSIGYIIRKGPGMISDRAEPIEDAKIDDIDVDYYIENQLLPPVARILEALGYSKEHLKGGLVQNNLKKWF